MTRIDNSQNAPPSSASPKDGGGGLDGGVLEAKGQLGVDRARPESKEDAKEGARDDTKALASRNATATSSSSLHAFLRSEAKGEDGPAPKPMVAAAPDDGAPPGMERDSAAGEDDTDLRALLLPPGLDPFAPHGSATSLQARGLRGGAFSLALSPQALAGWVKQPSPCCAAASAAGAWNACLGLQRSDPRAESHLTMVPRFAGLLQDQADAKRGRLERLLGAPLQPLLEALVAALATSGKSLGGKKGDAGCTKAEALALVKTLVRAAVSEEKRAAAEAAAEASRSAQHSEGEEKEGTLADEAAALPLAPSPFSSSTGGFPGSGFPGSGGGDAAAGGEPTSYGCPAVFLRLGELYDAEDATTKAKAEARAKAEAAAKEGGGGDGEGCNYEDDEEDDKADSSGADEEDGAGHDEEEEEEEEEGGGVNGGTGGGGGGKESLAMSADKPAATATKAAKKKAGGPKKGGKKAGGAKKGAKRAGGGAAAWAWKKELGEWLHKLSGLEKISAARPSTAPFGNWGVLGALRRLNDERWDERCGTCGLGVGMA